MAGTSAAMERTFPALAGKSAAKAGKSAALVGKSAALAGTRDSLAGKFPALAGELPGMAARRPALAGNFPGMTGNGSGKGRARGAGRSCARGAARADNAGMCGLVGVVRMGGGRAGELPRMDAARIAAARETMRTRGPDSAGLWTSPAGESGGAIILGHRRLAVVETSAAGAQPFVSSDGRYALAYNGELYNDAELRRELAASRVLFRTRSDTETVLRALMAWGAGALPKLRGMFALAFADSREGTVLLARDTLGMKPLYWARAGDGPGEVVFASAIPALFYHPDLAPRPDPVGISAYLSTIRTTLGDRTLFSGVRALPPGGTLLLRADGAAAGLPAVTAGAIAEEPSGGGTVTIDEAVAAERVRRVVSDAVLRHLRADVPVCCLLSGGLDSSIIAAVAAAARDNAATMRTYCAGAEGGADFAAARLMAAQLGSVHTEAIITRDLFLERWGAMVEALGAPLSTPNEVAINEVARVLRSEGMVVALSGEGADELFGGYEGPLTEAAAYERGDRAVHPGEFQLRSCAWIAPELKAAVLNDGPLRGAEDDAALFTHYREEFVSLAAGAAEPLAAHLRFHRRINLAGLLARLDTATMLESVEGRTPFADRAVLTLAESLPMDLKFRAGSDREPAQTKRVLRAAFADMLPEEIKLRPKASFPLPFQEWMTGAAGVLESSAFAREWFTDAARAVVRTDPARAWNLAWPMLNIARWGQRWWG